MTFWIGSRSLDHLACPVAELHTATFATLTFTRQKNGVRNEKIGHGRSGHAYLCPVLCLVDIVLYLRAQHALPATPLNAFRPANPGGFRYVLSRDLTHRIRTALSIHPHPSYHASDVSARSTRAGGARARVIPFSHPPSPPNSSPTLIAAGPMGDHATPKESALGVKWGPIV